jgi:hypothetical protein
MGQQCSTKESKPNAFAPALKFHQGLLSATIALLAPIFIGYPNIREGSDTQEFYSCFISFSSVVIIVGTFTAIALQYLYIRDSLSLSRMRYEWQLVVAIFLCLLPAVFGIGMFYTAYTQTSCLCSWLPWT